MDDAALDLLVGRAANGEREAFELVFTACYRDLRAYVAVRIRSDEATDEVVQATFVAALEGLSRYRLNGAFRAWLRGIAAHRVVDARRESARTQSLTEGLEGLLLVPATIEDGQSEHGLAERVGPCLDRLVPHARALAERRWMHREAVQDLAAELGRSALSLSVSLHRIRQALKTCIEAVRV
jgi:RNA polymerase sigma-70 factor, ECF subfamily